MLIAAALLKIVRDPGRMIPPRHQEVMTAVVVAEAALRGQRDHHHPAEAEVEQGLNF